MVLSKRIYDKLEAISMPEEIRNAARIESPRSPREGPVRFTQAFPSLNTSSSAKNLIDSRNEGLKFVDALGEKITARCFQKIQEA
jgi:hypothetical protein